MSLQQKFSRVELLEAWRIALAENQKEALVSSPRPATTFKYFAQHYEQLTSLPRKSRRAMQRQWKHSLAGIALLLALGAGQATAATITVDDVSPGVGAVAIADDAVCSLGEAILSANEDNAGGSGCTDGSGDDEIVLPANSTFSFDGLNSPVFPGENPGDNALPLVSSVVTISGNGSTLQRVNAEDRQFRLIAVNQFSDLTLNDLTVTGGDVRRDAFIGRGLGGGILSGRGARLTLNNTTVSGNFSNRGGGVNAATNLGQRSDVENPRIQIRNSTISDNTALSLGGGLVISGTFAEISNSVISGNTTLEGPTQSGGGGIHQYGGFLTITDSTIADNTTEGDGGALCVEADQATFTRINRSTLSGNAAGIGSTIYSALQAELDVSNSTISGSTGSFIVSIALNNPAPSRIVNSTITGINIGSAIGFVGAGNGGPLYLANTIVSNDSDRDNCLRGDIVDGGNNLINDDSCFGAGSGTDANAINLEPLADNGGPTKTHALLADSVAIDAGNNSLCAEAPIFNFPNFQLGVNNLDQRGVTRPQDGDNDGAAVCDIGAFELVAAPDVVEVSAGVTISFSGFRLNRRTGQFVQQVTVSNSSDSALADPLSLVLDNLSSNATLTNADDQSSDGTPFITLDSGGDGLDPNESTTVSLMFDNPSRQPINYDTRVLSGSP